MSDPLEHNVLLVDHRRPPARPGWRLEEADAGAVRAHRRLRQRAFVEEQGLFAGTDLDDTDADPRTVVLVARGPEGAVLGGVRLAPVGADVGWWTGSRLVVAPGTAPGVGPALVAAACARAEQAGALRFDATVQDRYAGLFTRLGWQVVGPAAVAGRPHTAMTWPIGRLAALARATKSPLGGLLAGFHSADGGLGGAGFVGDDGAPVPGTDVVAACDAILPSMVERDPGWAGWCGVLVNVNDLSAMGAAPVGLLDAVGARDASFAARVVAGLRAGSQAWGVPVLGGHTQLGVPAALSVTALGRTDRPVPASGGRPGQRVRLTADLGGGWRPGATGRQWDSTTGRTTEELRLMGSVVARSGPAAAKDVSMAGLVGTLGMLAEASGCGAVLDVAAVPRPAGATVGDWFTCFPGSAFLTTDVADRDVAPAGPATTATCGELVPGAGVHLRWPDGSTTPALAGPVTGLGASRTHEESP
ncbi:MSMEG_0567/sll0787 family protein [Klenkia taihuensis]|uniref:Putative N-acetyltransferase, MSMEG_0567 N-terminal domain family n=1 Tax=Klenkia taihuensis TaxID=1225127 RepID=A0A1I1R912_9ACTN|nr:MSMEG_0567/sll0787 family protein [Klenkia taihuensis]GHE07124.1 AIR synthase [Klenkia taihuensis]SFD30795.1 putative N-acetyltransferase, MSMEG_0567 N-terminal domain family [Klenkia taihuensis]